MEQNDKIYFNIDRSKIEGIQDLENEYFPSHFLGLICGWPGSGKTTLIKFILKHPKLLYKKYDEILILSPSS
jgi:type IV secretory pathway VirB4 component